MDRQARITASGRIFRQENANPICRKSFTNIYGDKIGVMGRHGFEWTVVIQRSYGPCKSVVFREGRTPALAYYKKMCEEFKDNKHRKH